MEQASNIFTDGLVTDLHPLTTAENKLTDALNATTITFNGNEMILQNDMGNTLIQDTSTGNVMGLSDGFVPVGMKEYGGVLYIASMNPSTGEGELGTIPSPKINYVYYDPEDTTLECTIADSLTSSDPIQNVDYDQFKVQKLYDALESKMTIINSNLLKCGDQFIVVLDFDKPESGDNFFTKYVRRYWRVKGKESGRVTNIAVEPKQITTQELQNTSNIRILGKINHSFKQDITIKDFSPIEYPAVSQFTPATNDTFSKICGWYDLCLYAVVSGKTPIRLEIVEKIPQQYYIKGQEQVKTSKYWFIPKEDLKDKDNTDLEIDTEKCQQWSDKKANVYRKYPNVLKGKLAVKLEANIPMNVTMLTNKSTNLNTPFTFVRISKTKN